MACFLLVSSGIPSPTNSVVAFGERLAEDGHSVSVAAPKQAKELVEARGLTFREIPPPRVNAFAPMITRPKLAERLRPGERGRRAERAIRAFGVDRFADLLAEAAPDLVIADAELHAHIMVAHARGYKVVLCSSMYVTPPSSERPPLHYAIVPGRGIRGTLIAVRLSWIWHRIWRMAVICRKKVQYLGGDFATAAEHLAKKIVFDLPAHRNNHSWQMPWSLKFRTLIMLPAELDFPPQTLPAHDYIGPITLRHIPNDHEHASIAELFGPGPEGIANPRRILAAFGTLLTPEPAFIKELWAALERNPDWTLLCVLGRNHQAQFGTPPGNVLVADWVPQAELLTYADAFVFPGGSASIVEAVAAQTAMLIYPRTIDQYGNGARVEYHGLGKVGQTADGADQIESRLQQIMDDPGISNRLQAFKEAQECYATDKIAEQIVANLLASQHG